MDERRIRFSPKVRDGINQQHITSLFALNLDIATNGMSAENALTVYRIRDIADIPVPYFSEARQSLIQHFGFEQSGESVTGIDIDILHGLFLENYSVDVREAVQEFRQIDIQKLLQPADTQDTSVHFFGFVNGVTQAVIRAKRDELLEDLRFFGKDIVGASPDDWKGLTHGMSLNQNDPIDSILTDAMVQMRGLNRLSSLSEGLPHISHEHEEEIYDKFAKTATAGMLSANSTIDIPQPRFFTLARFRTAKDILKPIDSQKSR